MTWIYAIPAWLFMSASVIGATGIACALLNVTRKHLSQNEQIRHNDVAGPILTIIGTVLAVLMSFMVVGVWQEYDNAAETAQQEASALSDLHHLAEAFPDPFRTRVQGMVDEYIDIVINREWPEMKRGEESRQAHDVAYAIVSALDSWRPRDSAEQSLRDRGEVLAGAFLDRRRDRILANRQGIPILLWVTMLFTGAVTVMFSFYFRVEQVRAHYVMIAAETAVITLIFTLIAELDYPFRGDIAIDPYSFIHVVNALHGTLPGASY